LIRVGRMYGEPGDTFHDLYVEGNFAFRVALRNCRAAIRLTEDERYTAINDPQCAGAFSPHLRWRRDKTTDTGGKDV
jgi:hypothetical protein